MLVIRAPGSSLLNYAQNRAFNKVNENSRNFIMVAYADFWMKARFTALNILIFAIICMFCLSNKGLIPSATTVIVMRYFFSSEWQLFELFIPFSDTITFLNCSMQTFGFMRNIPAESSTKSANESKFITNGEIHVSNLSVKYKENLPLIIKNASFDIRAGEKIGLVGRTGCGKSTILLSFMRILEPELESSIKIDNVEITKQNIKDIRKNIIMVPQEPWIISGNIRENIDPAKQFTDIQIIEILKSLHLYELIEKKSDRKFKNVLDALISENGNNISQGEKQLICLARALIKNPRIMLLDEATAGLDKDSEKLVSEIIKNDMKNTTVIMIGHRESSLEACNRIIKVEDGKCINLL